MKEVYTGAKALELKKKIETSEDWECIYYPLPAPSQTFLDVPVYYLTDKKIAKVSGQVGDGDVLVKIFGGLEAYEVANLVIHPRTVEEDNHILRKLKLNVPNWDKWRSSPKIFEELDNYGRAFRKARITGRVSRRKWISIVATWRLDNGMLWVKDLEPQGDYVIPLTMEGKIRREVEKLL